MLYMVELTSPDPDAAARWYATTLGFAVELSDAAAGFHLLAHPGGGKLAVKRGGAGPMGVTLHLQVTGLDGHVERLRGLGVAFDGGVNASAEGYRRAKVLGPDGVVVVLFEWCRPEN